MKIKDAIKYVSSYYSVNKKELYLEYTDDSKTTVCFYSHYNVKLQVKGTLLATLTNNDTICYLA